MKGDMHPKRISRRAVLPLPGCPGENQASPGQTQAKCAAIAYDAGNCSHLQRIPAAIPVLFLQKTRYYPHRNAML